MDRWRKSSHSFSNGNRVEVTDDWRTSSHSIDTSCVEVGGRVRVRDSQDRGGPVLAFTPDAWAAFTGRIRRA